MTTKVSPRMIEGSSVNVKAFGALGDGIADDTAAIQAASDFAKDNGKVNIHFPSGRYITTSSILIDGSFTVTGDGMGFRDSLGSVIERREGTGSTEPVFEIGTTQSIPQFHMSDMTIVGDTTVRHDGIYTNTTGLHNASFERLHIEYVQGKPIHINSPSSVARPESVSFRDISLGMDWGNYDGRDSSLARSDDPDGAGIYFGGSGTADLVDIQDCMILSRSNGFNAGVRLIHGDIVNIINSGNNGATYGIDCRARELNIIGGYIEGCEFATVLRNNFSSRNQGCKVFNIEGTLFSSDRYLVSISDDSADMISSTKGSITNTFIYSNFTDWTAGTEIIQNMGAHSVVYLNNISSNMTTEFAGASTDLRFIGSSVSNPENVYGQQRAKDDGQRVKLIEPSIVSAVDNGLGNYRYEVNDSATNDFGIRLLDRFDEIILESLPSDTVGTDRTSLSLYSNILGIGPKRTQVRIGAVDSGGTGLRALTIPNTPT